MKFVTFQVMTPIGAVNRVGILRESGITDVNAVYGRYLREVKKMPTMARVGSCNRPAGYARVHSKRIACYRRRSDFTSAFWRGGRLGNMQGWRNILLFAGAREDPRADTSHRLYP